MKNRRSFIIGLKSKILLPKEKNFLKKYKPWGVILFSRNISSISQTKKLTNNIRKIFKDKKYPILVDQEGGRVNRFYKFFNTSNFSSEFFGKLYKKDIKKFNTYYKIFIDQTSYFLEKMGININTVPVLDVRHKQANNIIGDRAYDSNPKIISKIGDYCIKIFHKNKIATVIKHIPGHGRATVDSHKYTPLVINSLKQLLNSDFYTFKNKKSLFAMTAHIIYQNIDKKFKATH